MNTLEAFHMRCQRQIIDVCYSGFMSPMQRCFSDLVCQPLMTSDIIDAYLWPCCTPGPWSTSARCSASDGGYIQRQKANCQLEKTAGPPSQRLAKQGSRGCQRCTAIYAVDIQDHQGSWSGATMHSDYATMTMMMNDVRLV